MKIPEPIRDFVEMFSELPGIGPRQAIRLAFHVIDQGKNFSEKLGRTISSLSALRPCSQCFYIQAGKDRLCEICGDPRRNKNIVAVVEKPTDLLSIENTKKFNGHYLVIGDLRKTGVLSAEQKLRLNALKSRLKKNPDGKAEEIIIAINPTSYGDLNAAVIAKELAPFAGKLSRLGRGIPTGGEIEFADEETLTEALRRRS
jgi:recombination protein RecR